MIIEGQIARCRECGKELNEHDEIDCYFPYFTENNLCQDCKANDTKSKRKDEWEKEMKEAKPTDNTVEMDIAKQLVEDLRLCSNQGGQNIKPDDNNQYAVGYWVGIKRETMSLIATSPISKQAWQAAGLTFDEMEMCNLEIIG